MIQRSSLGLIQPADHHGRLSPAPRRRLARVRTLVLHPLRILALPPVDGVEDIRGCMLNGESGLVERGAHVLAAAAVLAPIERARDAERQQRPGHEVGGEGVEETRLLALERCRGEHQPGRRRGLEICTGVVAVRTLGAHR